MENIENKDLEAKLAEIDETIKIMEKRRKELIKNKLLYLLFMLIWSLSISFISFIFGILFNIKFTTFNILAILLVPFFINILRFLSHKIELNMI